MMKMKKEKNMKYIVNNNYSCASSIKVVFIAVTFISLIILGYSDFSYAQRTHTVYYEGTEHELHVYRIHGKDPGNTIMLIGGIQGDEPGGFLSADLYADFSLSKGNLIVVPRANFQSILLNRRKINEDMNRKFAEVGEMNYEAKVVMILKKLIAESDCLLNLHDGSGFYCETYKDPMRNPKRYGQSIIADTEKYVSKDKGTVVELGRIGRSVVEEINRHIKRKDYLFHFNNHRTSDMDSIHKEQRKSATYYAVTVCGIPAFGVETSKSLPLELKIEHHNYAINAFMRQFGVIPKTPGVNLEPPEFKYLVVSVNDSLPVVIENQQTLSVNYGDKVSIMHIEANYERGLSADFINYGSTNDLRKQIKITQPTRVVVRKDSYPCGSIYVSLGGVTQKLVEGIAVQKKKANTGPQYLLFKMKINGEERILQNYSEINIVKGDHLEIEDVITSFADPSDITVNFKGFVGDRGNNDGEDRGFIIDTGEDLWERYSLDGNGRKYQVIAEFSGELVGKFFVSIESPALNYVLFKLGEDHKCFLPGDTIEIGPNKTLKLLDIITDIKSGSIPKAYIVGPSVKHPIIKDEIVVVENLISGSSSGKFRIEIKRDSINIGSVGLKVL